MISATRIVVEHRATLAEWLTGIGTVLVVGVALVWQPLRKWWRRPSLKLEEDPAGSQLEGPEGTQTFWIRLAVTNERKKNAARRTEVLLQGVDRLDPAERVPLTVKSLNWTGLDKPEALVGPGLRRTVDLGILFPPGPEFPPAVFLIQLTPQPLHGRQLLDKPGGYRIHLALTASNFNAALYDVALWFDGKWAEGDDIWKHLTVKVEPARA